MKIAQLKAMKAVELAKEIQEIESQSAQDQLKWRLIEAQLDRDEALMLKLEMGEFTRDNKDVQEMLRAYLPCCEFNQFGGQGTSCV